MKFLIYLSTHLKGHILLWVILSLHYSEGVFAQVSFGVSFDESDYKKVPLIEPAAGVKGFDFDTPEKLSLRPFCPVPGEQGETGTCTAYATGYSAMTLYTALEQRVTDSATLAQMTFSAAFIYNQIKKNKGDCSEGIAVENALRLLKSTGNCRFADFDTIEGCDHQPDSMLLDSVGQHQILDYAAILPFGANSAQTISMLLQFLSDSIPPIIVFRAYENFVRPLAGEPVWSKLPEEQESGLHCMVVTGYDKVERSFEVMSSWGTDWADHGFYKVNWNDMGAATLAAYIIVPNLYIANTLKEYKKTGASPASPTLGTFALEGDVEFVRVEKDGSVQPSESFFLDENTGFYKPVSGVFPLNTLYQLYLSGTTKGKYVYVFSCDAQSETKMHFPKLNYSALSPGRYGRTAIPSTQSALRLNLPGDDLVCILYSQQEIPDIKLRIQSLKWATVANFKEKFKDAFEDLQALPFGGNQIQYTPDQLSLRAKLVLDKGSLVPMVLWLQAEEK